MACNIGGITRIETLHKENYDTWCMQAEALLVKNDLWDYVNGKRERPRVDVADPQTEAAARQWDINDKKAKSDLILTISPSELKQVKACETANDVWTKLRNIYASKGPAKRAALLRKLTSHRMASGEDVREHINKFIEVVDKLAEMNIDIHKDLQSAMLLNSLPENYENFRCAMESRDDLPDLDTLKIKILEEFETRHQKTSEDHGAMIVKGNYRRNEVKPKAPWNNTKEQRNNTKEQWNNTKENVGRKPRIICHKCGKPGHKAFDCYSRKTDYKQYGGKSQELFYVNYQNNNETYIATEDPEKEYWCLDSGCTTHLCKDSSRFIQMQRTDHEKLNLANNAMATVKAKGNVRIKTRMHQEIKDIEFEDALYVPELRTNLMSVAKITDKGNSVIFRDKEAIVVGQNGRVKLKANRIGNLYYICEERSEAAKNICSEGTEESQIKLWHERMGHLNVRDLLDAAKKEHAIGIKIQGETQMPICEICIQGKLTSTPFPKNSQRSSKLLEIVHSDVCGPMSIQSPAGSRYMLLFIDDYSRWSEVYFLKRKDEVLQKFKEYKSYVERRTGQKIKYLQTDNGREYCNKEFNDFLQNEGIQRRLTVPYTPEQNGVAERKNRTLIQTARCMLLRAQLTHGFWAEAVLTANYLRNRCPTKTLEGRTPFEFWNNRKPILNHLKVFGMKAYVLNKEPNKSKFAQRTKVGTFIGYSETSKAYRVWIPNERRVIVSRDIRVIERESYKTDKHLDQKISQMPEKCEELDTCIGNNNAPVEPIVPSLENAEEQIEDQTSEEETPAENQDERRLCRAPGRPRIERTGRRGRPRKLFNYRAINDQPDLNEDTQENTDESHEESRSEVTEDREINPAELVASIAEVSMDDALTSTEKHEWIHAIRHEVRNLIKNDTFNLVQRPTKKRVIGCRTVLTNKYNSDGSLAKRKARIVAKGFAQRPGIEFFDTFAPVARLESIRLLLSLAVKFGMTVEQMDVTSAYLNGTLSEEVYMEKPELLSECLNDLANNVKEDRQIRKNSRELLSRLKENKDLVCHLNKAIYGLRQSGRQWHKRLSQKLKEMGFKSTVADPCVYYSKRGEDTLFMAIYVDDMLIISKDLGWIAEIKNQLADEFDVKDLGKAQYCLGIEIEQTPGKIAISQKRYILDLLKRFGLENCNPVATPLDKDTALDKIDGDRSNRRRPYRELVGALMYLAVATRPDISYAVSTLAQFNECNGEAHWAAGKRVLRYLKGTLNYGIVYRKSDDCPKVYVDADWGRCKMDRRSYTGYVTVLSNGPISWRSTKQRTVALSSTEAEYMAMAEAVKDAIYFSDFLKEIGFSAFSKMTVYNDNLGAQLLAKNPIVHPRTKHINLRFHFLRDVFKEDNFQLEHLSSENMPADVLTKPLPKYKHHFCIKRMGVELCNDC